MSVYATIAVVPGEFVLPRTLAVAPGARLELEAVVPFAGRPLPYLLIEADDPAVVVDLVAAEPAVRRVDRIHCGDEEAVIAVEWGGRRIALLDAVVAAEGACIDAVAARGTWHLTLRFPSHDRVTDWYRRCRDHGVGLTIERIRDGGPSTDSVGVEALTDPQREALAVALEAGYFAVPRDATLQEVATALDVSDTAASQRIRRGVDTLLTGSIGRRVDAEN